MEETPYEKINKLLNYAVEMIEKAEIIADIAKEGTLREIIRNVGGTKDEDLRDLEQDIYLELLRKDVALLNTLREKGELKYYLAKIVKNQIYSKTSPYYHKYKKQNEKKDDRHICDFGEI